jgi:CheY-like chemotaxis protein
MGQSKPPHIALVVEDDRETRNLAAMVLEESDLTVAEAESAEEALHFLQDHASEVALVFADVRLPCLMDGVDLARRVHLKWPWIHLVVTSGAEEEDRIGDLPREASFMPKPWRALDVLIHAERAKLEGSPPIGRA